MGPQWWEVQMSKKLGMGICVVLLLLAGCGGGGGGGSDVAPPPPFSVTITPTSSTLEVGDTLQFSSEVNRSDFAVTWYVNDIEGGNTTVGTITAGGLLHHSQDRAQPRGGSRQGGPPCRHDKVSHGTTHRYPQAVGFAKRGCGLDRTYPAVHQQQISFVVRQRCGGGNATVGTISSPDSTPHLRMFLHRKP